jgi:hypothetical protein
MTDSYACAAGEGISPPVTCGITHQVTLTLVDSTNAPISAVETMSVFVPCAGVATLPHTVFEVGGGAAAGKIKLTWSLTQNGAPVSCAAGDEVDVRVDTDAMTVTFPCSDGTGTTPDLTCGENHNVSLMLFDHNGTQLSATSAMTIFVPCGATQNAPAVVFETAGSCAPSQIKTTWSLSQNGQPVSCAAGDEVDLRIDTDAMTVTFPCSAMMGTSPNVTGGVSHNVSLKLFDKNGVLLSETGVMSLQVPCGTVQSTPKVDFSLTP